MTNEVVANIEFLHENATECDCCIIKNLLLKCHVVNCCLTFISELVSFYVVSRGKQVLYKTEPVQQMRIDMLNYFT